MGRRVPPPPTAECDSPLARRGPMLRALLLVACLVVVGACDRRPAPEAHKTPDSGTVTLETHAYVWRREALDACEPGEDGCGVTPIPLWWLAGEVDLDAGAPKIRTFAPGPNAGERDVVGVVCRARTPVVRWLKDAAPKALRDDLVRPLATALANAAPGIARFQLDFDCPTAKLASYGNLLRALRMELPEAELSITALPDWLRSSDFASLWKHIDFYVLQLHGLEVPVTLADKAPIFDCERAREYLKRGIALGSPFHIALPTYGHRQWFRPDGGFVGISAEAAPSLSEIEHIIREERADAETVAAFVAALQDEPHSALRGVFWFRLPSASDVLNWSYHTFGHVVRGVVPPATLEALARHEDDGRVSVLLCNSSEYAYRGLAEIRVHHAADATFWAEGASGFEVTRRRGAVVLVGKSPEPGQTCEAGWLRIVGASRNETLTLGEIEVRGLQ